MKNFNLIAFSMFIILVSFPQKSSAEVQDQVDLLTLEKCMAVSIEKNSFLRSKLINVKVSQEKVSEAKANYYYPDIVAKGQYSYNGVSPTQVIPVPPHQLMAAVQINKTLYSFGRLENQLKLSQYNYLIEKLEVLKAINDLTKNVKMAFYTVLINLENVRVYLEAEKIWEQNLAFNKKNYEVGKLTKSDYLRTLTQKKDNEMLLEKAKEQLIKSVNNLYTLMGSELIDRYEDIPKFKEELKANTTLVFDDLTLKEAVQIAKKNRPEVSQLISLTKVYQLEEEIASSFWKPTISAFGNLQDDYTQSIQLGRTGYTLDGYKNKIGWQLGVQTTIPLSELILPNSKSKSQEKGSEYKALGKRYELADLEKTIEKQITENYISFKEAKKNIKRAKEILDIATENFKIATIQFEQGTLNSLSYRDIELKYIQAQLDYYNEIYNYNLSYLNLIHAMGGNIVPIK